MIYQDGRIEDGTWKDGKRIIETPIENIQLFKNSS